MFSLLRNFLATEGIVFFRYTIKDVSVSFVLFNQYNKLDYLKAAVYEYLSKTPQDKHSPPRRVTFHEGLRALCCEGLSPLVVGMFSCVFSSYSPWALFLAVFKVLHLCIASIWFHSFSPEPVYSHSLHLLWKSFLLATACVTVFPCFR